jgi:hypothetical protein
MGTRRLAVQKLLISFNVEKSETNTTQNSNVEKERKVSEHQEIRTTEEYEKCESREEERETMMVIDRTRHESFRPSSPTEPDAPGQAGLLCEPHSPSTVLRSNDEDAIDSSMRRRRATIDPRASVKLSWSLPEAISNEYLAPKPAEIDTPEDKTHIHLRRFDSTYVQLPPPMFNNPEYRSLITRRPWMIPPPRRWLNPKFSPLPRIPDNIPSVFLRSLRRQSKTPVNRLAKTWTRPVMHHNVLIVELSIEKQIEEVSKPIFPRRSRPGYFSFAPVLNLDRGDSVGIFRIGQRSGKTIALWEENGNNNNKFARCVLDKRKRRMSVTIPVARKGFGGKMVIIGRILRPFDERIDWKKNV